MGSPKALLDFHGECFLDRLTRLFAACCAPVVVVLGHEPEAIRCGLRHPERACFVVNPDYRQGQLTSVQCGLRAVPPEADGVLFTLVDHPNVRGSTLERLIEHRNAPVAIPTFQGRRGHPVFFHRDLTAELLALPPDSQARVVVRRHASPASYVEVDDPGVLDDIDDAAAYRRLIGVP